MAHKKENETRSNIMLFIGLAGLGLTIIGVFLSHGEFRTDMTTLDTNQDFQHRLLVQQAAKIDSLIAGQKQLHERILQLPDSSDSTSTQTSQTQSAQQNQGNDVTETLDYIGDVPRRVGREAERFIDKINPF